uniref:Alkylated DNA repair protein alkB homolog 7 n=1 Tax=Caligus rogercresseyi TaxID=217165 RepID=C1BNF1_CALRO|nr:Alkylated DNA repair protein alkB homolog 7 precursor [Caligus rogercresseyi]
MRLISALLSTIRFSGPGWTKEPGLQSAFSSSFTLIPDFISPDEEKQLFREVEPVLKRLVFEKDHWDDAILHFRETEKKHWRKGNASIIQRIHDAAFESSDSIRPLAHILDLASNGLIKPHVDSIKFCGSTISVLSLLSSSIARFRVESDRETYVDVPLPARSLYILKGASRYDFTHEILGPEEDLNKGRRISIVIRNEVK